jgi:hypothetical protein
MASLFPFREWEHLGIKKADRMVGEICLLIIPSLYNPGFEVGVIRDQINYQYNQKNDFPVIDLKRSTSKYMIPHK